MMQINSDTITSPNRFPPLQNYELSKSEDDNTTYPPKKYYDNCNT